MKFGKEFTAQMIQEWQEAYMDYNQLKSILKDILTLKHQNSATSSTPSNDTTNNNKRSTQIMRKVSLSRVFSGLTATQSRNSSLKREDDTIFVSLVKQGGVEERYQTTLLKSSGGEGDNKEVLFFRRLDQEFNKVLSFYEKKVDEVVAEADELTKQMDALIALRIQVSNPGFSLGNHRPENVHVANTHHHHHHHQDEHMDTIPEEDERGREMTAMMRPSTLQILDHVKINVGPKTPISALKAMLASPSSKEQLKKSEELMAQAFVEYYQQLNKLKRYSFMNQLAVSKIMKKYDKITLKNASKSYLDMVDKSYLGTCDKVTKLMKRVEAAFIKHFADGNHGKGMEVLRPKKRTESHRVTFSLGFLSGCSIALLVTILVIIQSRNLIGHPDRGKYMDNVFPLYILFGFIVLHMISFGANIYYWRRHRVNYPFIFGIKEGTELCYREVFLLSAGLSVLTLAAVVSNLNMDTEQRPNNLNMDMNQRTNRFAALPELVPLILVGVIVVILFCPLNIIYRSTRYFLITCLFHCLLAPFYKVTLPDFFMADQLTSQVQSFRSLQFYVCYYIWGNFRERDSNRCLQSDVYKIFYIVVAIIPFWFRFLQCIRRLTDERCAKHTFNALKYVTIMVALAARTIYVLAARQSMLDDTPSNMLPPRPSNMLPARPSNILYIVVVSTSGVATIYAIYWDIVVDWGLLRRNSKNPWLRDKLILSNKTVYFIAIILNCFLRVAWMQSVSGFTQGPYLHRKALIALVACLEIIRRGIWNFFRLENEHLNNVGKYRAFKSVPLPFNYDYSAKHT